MPIRAQSWAKDNANLEPDLFEYLASVGQTSNTISKILSKYGSQDSTNSNWNLKIPWDAKLTDSEAAFIHCLKAVKDNATTDGSLIAAVNRQESFVDKMHAQLWIRSPAVEGTLQRAIDRYHKFTQLFQLYPDTVLVPTLDIDLAWHTHQCSAAQYRRAMINGTGRFINHDDRIDRPVLDTGLEKTRRLFRIRFGQEYLCCNCWDCEAILSAVSAPRRPGTEGDRLDAKAVAKEILADVSFHRAVELARRAGKPLPVRGS